MKEVEIKDISGKVRFSTPVNKGAKGKFTLMKEDYIILPFSVAKPVAFKMGDYVDLSEVLDESLGGKLSKIYEIVDLQKPTYNSSTGGYDYELKLDAYYWKWKNKIFKYTPENAGSEASWTLTAGLDVQLGVFLRNLKALGYTYKGKDYVFEIDSTVENKAVAMTYDNINLLDALFSMAGEDKWNCDCWVEENVIHFGRNEFGDAVKIERDIEASSITRSESQGTYATRIYAFGGTRNIPNNYGRKFIDSVSFIQGNVRFTGLLNNTNYYLEDGADVQIRFLTGSEENNVFPVHWTAGNFYFEDGTICKAVVGDRFELLNFPDNVPDKYLSFSTEDLVVNGVVQKRLMMPADTPYIDVYPDMSQEEAVESIVVFDDIYPKRIGTMSDVNTVPSDIKEDDKVVGTFDAYQYKDAGLVFDKKYQIEGTELKITFQSGKMNGMEFGVIFEPNDKDEQLWEIVRNEDYGRPLPDEYIHPENGDQYVLSGFNIKLVSDQYIPSAEQELKERAQKYADKTKIDDGTYPVTLRSDWVKEDLISRTFDFGQRINLVDDTFFENGRISRVLGWEMNLDIPWDSPVYTIGESMPYSRIEEIEEKVDSIIYNGQTYNGNYGGGGSYVYVIKTNDSTSPTDSNVFSALRSLATFLRKDRADSTKYLLTMLSGAIFGDNKASIDTEGLLTAVNAIIKGDVKSDNFLAGALGTGYALLKKDADGKSYIEVDKIFARVKAIFAVLEIMKVTYTGGNFVFSPAGMQCIKVEEHDSFYRCYFTADDGEKAVENTFEVDDMVQLREFNVKAGVYDNVSNRYFWRRCIAKGDDYIDLSKADRDMTSNDSPMVGDSLVTIGNKTIKSRQNVIIISVYGEGCPSIIQYAGVNDYSLDGKAVTVISPSGNKFTGSFVIEATGKSVEDELSTAVEVANAAQKAAEQAQKDADAANSELGMIASDNYITPSEKTALKQQQADIQAERNEIISNATKYEVRYTSYDAAYTLANNALTKYTASSPKNIQVGTDYNNISAYYAARKTILDAIATAAKKLVTDLDDDLQGYKREVTQQFEAVDGKFTSVITETKTYTDNAIGNIQVGGRNIARETNNEWCPELLLTNGTNQCLGGFSNKIYLDTLKVGDEVVISFDYKWSNFVYGSNASINFQGSGNVTQWDGGRPTTLSFRNQITGVSGEKHISYVQTITADDLENQYWSVNIRHDYIKGSVTVRNFKAEKGNKATTWSPAPEDIDNNFETLSSEIKQTADNISLKVNQVTGGTNLLSNTSFSADLNGWSLLNSSTGMTAKIVSKGGYQCLELWTDGARRGLYAYLDNRSLVKAGDKFTISFDLYRTSSAVSTLAIGLEDGGADFIKKTLSGNLNTWVRLTYTQTMDTNNAAFIIYGAGNAGTVYIKNIKVEMGTIATAWTPSPLEQNNKLLATGIDIYNKRIDITADKLRIKNNSGTPIAVFDGSGSTPKLKAANIDVDNLKVKHLDGADGTFKGSLSAATGTFSGTITAGSVFSGRLQSPTGNIGDLEISGGYLSSNGGGKKGIAFTSNYMSNYFENISSQKTITMDPGDGYGAKPYTFTLLGNRKAEVRKSNTSVNHIYVADMMNIQYTGFLKDSRYGFQYAMLGSGHCILDGVVDGGCWGHIAFEENNTFEQINPHLIGNRIIITPSYSNNYVIFPTLVKMHMFLGQDIAQRVSGQFTYVITIINQSTNAVAIMGRANTTIGSLNLNNSQFPKFYNQSGTLMDQPREYTIKPFCARQFMLAYDGGEFYAFEL